MSFKYSIAARTHKGHVAARNEDYYIVDETLKVCFLADGMGGHVAGQQASQLACAAACRAYRAGRPLPACIEAAHAEAVQAIAGNAALHGMGTTLLAVALDAAGYELAWVGDSRAYHWRAGQLTQLSRDHNYAQALIARGMTAEQAWQDPQAACLTQAVGVHEGMLISVDGVRGQLLRDEFLLLCSDGLTDELSHAEIATLIKPTLPAETICENLMQAALGHGGRDNITVLLIRAAPLRHR